MQPAANFMVMYDPELEHVSFIFDTIELGSLIVCGLLALPHDLAPNQTQDDVSCACIAWVVNPCVAAHDPRSSPLACFARNGSFSAWFNPQELVSVHGQTRSESPVRQNRAGFDLFLPAGCPKNNFLVGLPGSWSMRIVH